MGGWPPKNGSSKRTSASTAGGTDTAESLGPVKVKGLDQPIELYRLA